jgi:hypothetical protein
LTAVPVYANPFGIDELTSIIPFRVPSKQIGKKMHDWCLRDDGVPVETATEISGFGSTGLLNTLRTNGALGRPGPETVQRVSLMEVAAARALFLAEMAGVVRERALPVITQMADAAYVQLARMELGKRSWDPRYVPSSSLSQLAEKMYTEEGLVELQDRLRVQSRNVQRFTIFTPEGPVFAASPPEASTQRPADPFVDVWNIAQHIRNKVDGRLFHGARADPLAA